MKRYILRGGNIVAAHEIFCKRLAPFKLRGKFFRTKNFQMPLFKRVDNALNQRHFRTDDGEINGALNDKRDQSGEIVRRDIHVFGDCRRARIAGGAIDFFHAGTLREFPRNRMFTPAGADYKNFHRGSFYKTLYNGATASSVFASSCVSRRRSNSFTNDSLGTGSFPCFQSK